MISTCIDATRGLVVHTGTGELSVDEIETALEKRFGDSAYRPGMKVLWDCRNASVASIEASALGALIAFNVRRAATRGNGKSAIVASKDADYGVCRMFQTLADHLPWSIAVFRDRESATLWLSHTD